MFVLALLLGWIPFLGPANAGFVGGLQAGDTRSALIAALIPSVIVAGLLFVLGSVVGLPIVAAIVSAGVVLLIGGSVPGRHGVRAAGHRLEFALALGPK